MIEKKHDQPRHGGPDGDGIHHNPVPYWKRAHHDWRFVVAVVLMLAAMVVYVLSEDLSLEPRGQSRQSMPEDVGQ